MRKYGKKIPKREKYKSISLCLSSIKMIILISGKFHVSHLAKQIDNHKLYESPVRFRIWPEKVKKLNNTATVFPVMRKF